MTPAAINTQESLFSTAEPKLCFLEIPAPRPPGASIRKMAPLRVVQQRSPPNGFWCIGSILERRTPPSGCSKTPFSTASQRTPQRPLRPRGIPFSLGPGAVSSPVRLERQPVWWTNCGSEPPTRSRSRTKHRRLAEPRCHGLGTAAKGFLSLPNPDISAVILIKKKLPAGSSVYYPPKTMKHLVLVPLFSTTSSQRNNRDSPCHEDLCSQNAGMSRKRWLAEWAHY